MTKFIAVSEEGKLFVRFIPITEIKKMYVEKDGEEGDSDYLITVETSKQKLRLSIFFDNPKDAFSFIRKQFEVLDYDEYTERI